MKAVQGTIDELEALPWNEVLPQLHIHALKRLRGRVWQGILVRGTAPGQIAEDVVQTAIERVLSGRRQRNTARYPDLVDYLENVVDSVIHQLAESWTNRHEHPRAVLTVATERAFEGAVASDEVEHAVVEAQEEEAARLLVMRFHDALSDEPLLQALFDLLEEEEFKRAALARALNVSPTAIDNARRRLERRYRAFMGQEQRTRIRGGGD